MRNQHVGRASRVALFAVLLVSLSMWACQDPQQEAPKDAGADAALGVDGDFGVETFSLSAPTLTFLLPTTTGNTYYLAANGAITIPGTPCQANICATTGTYCQVNSDCTPFAQLSATNFTLGYGQGEIHCRVNGGSTVYSTNPLSSPPSSVTGHNDMVLIGAGGAFGTKQGLYAFECVLANSVGQELTNPEARNVRFVQLLNNPLDLTKPKCNTDADCADGNNCSIDACIGGQCRYSQLVNCCTDDWICSPGETCIYANTANSKCSVCANNGDCSDGIDCTNDLCDLSGAKGVCNHTKTSPDACCVGLSNCDDSKPCTNDSCNFTTGKCVHDLPPNACCVDTDCTNSDTCTFATCVGLKCQIQLDSINRPDCCSATTNPTCDDKSSCTLDSCGAVKGVGAASWTQCIHTPDPLKPNCCMTSEDCNDGNGCTNDWCYQNKCTHPVIQECCVQGDSCDDKNACTDDSCPNIPGQNFAQCNHVPKANCCNIDFDCDDGLFCTTEHCDTTTHKCSHTTPDPTCCDFGSQCNDGKLCTADYCLAHHCAFPPDVYKPNCCEDTNPNTCNDKNSCTIDSCKIQTGCGGYNTPVADVTISGASSFSSPIGNTYVAQSYTATHAGLLGKVDVWVKPSVSSAAIDTAVYSLAPPSAGGIQVGAVTSTALPVPTGQYQKVSLTIAPNTLVTAGTVYYVTLHSNDPGLQVEAYSVNVSDVYPAGASWTGGPAGKGPWTNTGADFHFVTYYATAQPACDADNNTCQHVSNGVKNCCNYLEDCDDQDCQTLDICGTNSKCTHKVQPYVCVSNENCDDGNSCTVDSCTVDSTGCGSCKHVAAAGCCLGDLDCVDTDVCTLNKCDLTTNKCTFPPAPGCCNTNADALTICDDKNPCTIDYCGMHQCHHTLPKNGCCISNADCYDGNKCTTDLCDTSAKVGDHFTCKFQIQDPNCTECDFLGTVSGIDCNDNNLCTADSCDAALHCHNTPIANCCYDVYDCDDHNDCTADLCSGQHACFNSTVDLSKSVCCSPATEDLDCGYFTTECTKGRCVDAGTGNGATKCIQEQQEVCTVNVGYCQPFESSNALKAMGWNPMFMDNSTPSNWTVENTGNLGPDHYANFSWTPTTGPYGSCLQSPIIQAAGASTITVQYDHDFIFHTGGAPTQIKVLGSLGGATVDWTTATVIDSITATKDFGPETLDVKLPPELSGSNGLRLAFCLEGQTSFDLESFSLDNICIVGGHKPSMVACPVNQVVPFQTTKTIPLKAKDADIDSILSFQLVQAPSFVTLTSAVYFWLDKSWNTTLVINPTKNEHVGTFPVKIKVSDGALYSVCSFDVTVSYVGGYLVIRPPKGTDNGEAPVAHGDAWFQALHAAAPSKVVQHITDLDLYADYKGFEAVFVILGVYPNNHQLTDAQSTKFKNYLAGGGRLYMEGGDTWAYDQPTPLHPMFQLTSSPDNVGEGIATELIGQSIYRDLTTIVNGLPKIYSFGFTFMDAYNISGTIVANENVHRTQNLLQSHGFIDQPWVQVGHDDDSGYRSIASQVPYYDILPGPNSNDPPSAMVSRILNFFNNGFIDCLNDAGCDDQDDCTIDSCVKGECIHQNTCTCSSKKVLACGDSVDVITGLPGDTSSNKAYSCEGGVYGGKEKSYTFQSTSSRPVTLQISGATNDKARAFVLRSIDTVCQAKECIAVTGNGTKNFAAAKNELYYIVIDEPVNQSVQLTLQITCGEPELCADGIDNNNNGLVDCQDLASCCGDPACGEICDGVDNNCDGKIDEVCDKDGDGWCDAGVQVIGFPPVCSIGVGDCQDNNGAVNPGQADLCNNLVDDNCNGYTDEENSVGCTNFWIDKDGDKFGGGNAHCLCKATAPFVATQGGDCDDNNAKVNPLMIEQCKTAYDDNCDGSMNDQNAQGCKDFYLDVDGDGVGANPIGNTGKQCLCTGAGSYTALAPGDCNDSSAFVRPGATESCNNVDDNCNNTVDEGCDDDKDGYCDASMKYVSIGATSTVCGQGQDGNLVTVSCDTGRTITSIDFASFGNPTGVCGTYKAGTCTGGSTLQAVKTACLGKSSCSVLVSPSLLGDGCPGQAKVLDFQVTCMGSGGTPPGVCTGGPGDTNDNDPSINPNGKEICDNIDNNSDLVVDEGCDKDGDGFCTTDMVVLGAPFVCPAGGGDCNDNSAIINPAAQEDCSTTADDDCDGNLNNQDAKNCTIYFNDFDNDTYGTKAFKCYCNPVGLFKAKKTSDCNDALNSVHPLAVEACNGVDDDCDGVIDNGCDEDGDGYCAVGKVIVPGTGKCPNGGGDCDDTAFAVNPGKAEVCGDGIDNNCDGLTNSVGAVGCSSWYSDVDGDGYGSTNSKCQCAGSGSFTASVSGDCNDNVAAINPAAQEFCDNIDNNCSGTTDEQCDKDGDGYCDASKQIVGTPTVCAHGGNDCVDTNAAIHPNLSQEVCDNVDDDCDGVTDNGCDDDGDGYCDATYAVSTPPAAICSAGVNDCDDYDNTVHPNAPEICGNTKDDNCNGDQNDQNAVNCVNFYNDADGDTYGLANSTPKCLCVASGNYKVADATDCDDGLACGSLSGAARTACYATAATVHPNQNELCSTAFDDNCNGDTNDQDATGCTNYSLDDDQDGVGLTALTRCYCVGANKYTAPTTGASDCNDSSAAVKPGATEKCNDIDDNCNAQVDEGCNDDGDKFCDSSMVTVGFPNVCAAGGGDCNDTNAAINPGQPEICNDVDDNCNFVAGQGPTTIDEGCDDDNDHYCDANMVRVGTPSKCTLGGNDCDDTNSSINPGANELCSTSWDDNCNGDTNDLNATGCTAFGVDLDGDTYYDKTKATKCYCIATGTYTGTKPNDCKDQNNMVHPGLLEVCDDEDNDCDGTTDNGCDDDGDHWCDSSMTTIGKPAISCSHGGGDCNDNNASINPGVQENCATTFVDDNCSGSLNDNGALGCTTFYLDNDSDHYGVNVSQCTCTAANSYTINVGAGGLLGDCDDNNSAVNPGMPEICGDAYDNNCNGTKNDTNANGCSNFYVDADKDGYGPSSGGSQCQCFAQGSYVASLNGDCNDSNLNINPGVTERCDNLDNDCVNGTDNGCDDDGDGYCDATMLFLGPVTLCPNGTGDCNDTVGSVGFATHPNATEICDAIDQNCNSVTDEGCDDDKDTFCDKNMTVIYSANTVCPSTTNVATLDCDDTSSAVKPNSTEICDGLDNNCNGQTDEGCNSDGDLYCTSSMLTVGKPAVCTGGGGDCNDASAAINPGAAEICDGIDNNCVGGTDETCKDTDGDHYCVGTVIGTPAACSLGGNDCDDSNANVHPGGGENCATAYDDNCDGVTNQTISGFSGTSTRFYTDADGDGYGTGAGQLSCYQIGTFTALVNTDCNDAKATVNPAQIEICDGIDNNCDGSGAPIDEGCDNDADGYCDATMLMASTATCANTPKPAAGTTKSGNDCNDTVASINPGVAKEVCDNIDQNCNGNTDEGCDDDKDGYCDSGFTVAVSSPAVCPATVAFGGAGNDCNDNDALINPGVKENCLTAADDDCNGSTSATNANGCVNYYIDVDGDTYGSNASPTPLCICAPEVTGAFHRATVLGDCNDNSSTVKPGATEICDGIDNNCDALFTVDEGCDVDKDGFCKTSMTVAAGGFGAGKTCFSETSAVGTDCNDLDKTINKNAIELCDGQDNNCAGSPAIDEGCNPDGDLYCTKTMTTIGTPPICTGGGGDCDETNTAIYPGSAEVCNFKDDNCDGLTDNMSAGTGTKFYFDGDGDGDPSASFGNFCQPTGFYTYNVGSYTAVGGATIAALGERAVYDCDDNPLACGAYCSHALTENRCDGYNNNCDAGNLVDEGCDDDGDKYCDSAMTTVKSSGGAWPTACPTFGGGDCNDTTVNVNPGKAESCNNIDDNCNGSTDENASGQCAGAGWAAGFAVATCTGGACKFANCMAGYADVDANLVAGTTTVVGNGCECFAKDQYEPNDSCTADVVLGQATSLGTVTDGQSGSPAASILNVTGIVATTSDNDWYTFSAPDVADGNGGCDRYSVRAYFTGTPVSGVVFDMFRGTCPPTTGVAGSSAFTTTNANGSGAGPAWPNADTVNLGGTQPALSQPAGTWNAVCCGQQDFNWYTNFHDVTSQAKRPLGPGQFEEYGECPCSTGDTFDQQQAQYKNAEAGWGYAAFGVGYGWGEPGNANHNTNFPAYWPIEWGPWGGNRGQYSNASMTDLNPDLTRKGPIPAGWDSTKCVDDSATYYMRVYRTSGAVCAKYSIEISNGVYGAVAGGTGGRGYKVGYNPL